jgi:hypothetical protein
VHYLALFVVLLKRPGSYFPWSKYFESIAKFCAEGDERYAGPAQGILPPQANNTFGALLPRIS